MPGSSPGMTDWETSDFSTIVITGLDPVISSPPAMTGMGIEAETWFGQDGLKKY